MRNWAQRSGGGGGGVCVCVHVCECVCEEGVPNLNSRPPPGLDSAQLSWEVHSALVSLNGTQECHGQWH